MTAGTADDEFRSALCSVHSKNFITDRTSQSAGAGIRASIFNRCNDPTVGSATSACVMRRHYSHAHAVASCNKRLLAVGRVGNLLRGRPS